MLFTRSRRVGPAGGPWCRAWRQGLAAGWALALGLLAWPAAAAGVNGLWLTSGGDFAVFLQDSQGGATFSLQVPRSFDSLKVWIGTGSSTVIGLENLANPRDRIDATVAGSSMSGSITQQGVQQPFGADLALAWVSSDYAGVWQKTNAASDYLVFCLLNSGGAALGVQIDVSIKADKSYSYTIYTGPLVDRTFSGVSVTGDGVLSRLVFDQGSLTGSRTTPGRPPQTSTFAATHIVSTAR
jgi:hypothetical protein